MRLYWKETRRGMELLVQTDDGEEFSVGGVRETKRGVEALAKTTGYDPGRAIKGLSSLDEGRVFVEQFEPWLEFFPGEELAVEDKVLPREEA
ncbi:MAG: hypothetical protein WD208_13445 [Dehalococcoidia bacterium]